MMSGRPRDNLRLNIPGPLQSIGAQQPNGMYSPALPSALHNFHPGFPMGQPMHTPMQQQYFNIPPGAPGRHRQHASIAHMAPGMSSGQMSPFTPAFTPGHFPSPSMMYAGGPPLGNPGAPSFTPRSRRAPSVSVGGPPKAVLGGPNRKPSPLPPPVEASAPAPAAKTKKIVVNLPKETIPGEQGASSTRPAWARDVLLEPLHADTLPPPELTSGELFPSDSWRRDLPPSVDVFLPGKGAWDAVKREAIEEKLEKLGVEPSSSIPHIHAPHARAASISSPADPALLFFKLNKLQQTQSALSAFHTGSSFNESLSTSPQPGGFLEPAPQHNVNPFQSNISPRFMQGAATGFSGNRHGHSMSLAHPPTHAPFQLSQPPAFQPIAYGNSFNPFGPTATMGSDEVSSLSVDAPVFAPQARAPVPVASLVPPSSSSPSSRSTSRPDFSLGFGLDIPEESDEDAQEVEIPSRDTDSVQEEDQEEEEGGRTATHSRHVSHVSAALSLRTVGGNIGEMGRMAEDDDESMVFPPPSRSPIGGGEYADLDDVNEWTGSEGVPSDDESIGEWSNPSDEERARQDRAHRRLRRNREDQIPRRLPAFPRPPANRMQSDDDLISNPSEEGNQYLGDYYLPHNTGVSPPGRSLPPLPHSRATSIQHSAHDPAYAHSKAHSRTVSEMYAAPPMPLPSYAPLPASPAVVAGRPRSDSLNPFAAPFVFGAPRQNSESWSAISPQQTSASGHSRMPSYGKPLSAAATAFKPGSGFSFQPPPGGPKLSFPEPTYVARLSQPIGQTPLRAQQGREKRQRRASSSSDSGGDEAEVDEEHRETHMKSFRFPTESPQSIRRPQRIVSESPPAVSPERPIHIRRQSSLNATAPPFTFGGFSLSEKTTFEAEDYEEGSTAKAEDDKENIPEPAASTSKRLPIPLDFKPAPPTGNTVPAGLFKALVHNLIGEERTRRTVRSRLSSREIFDHESPRVSLGDMDIPTISRKISRSFLRAEPTVEDDMFSPHPPRRAGNPSHSRSDSIVSSGSLPALDLSTRMTFQQQYEQRLEALLDDKIAIIRQDLVENRPSTSGLLPSTEAMINEVVSLFRAQLSESAGRGLDEGQLEARGELDLELIKGVVQQGHADSLAWLQQELGNVVQRLSASAPPNGAQDLVLFAEQLTNRTMDAVVHAVSQLSVPSPRTSGQEREFLVNDLLVALAPTLHALRPETVDYDYLTSELSQAVKPHISQLIDLTSDKRETAGLIVESLRPMLAAFRAAPNPTIDTGALVATLTSEIRRLIAPIDAFEIKEQVADLVVERLDSRLAVRDHAFNVVTVTDKVTDRVARLLEPMQEVSASVGALVQGQHALLDDNASLGSLHRDVVALLSDLPSRLSAATSALGSAQVELASRPVVVPAEVKPDENVLLIKTKVDGVASSQEELMKSNERLLLLHQDVLEKLNALPETLSSAVSVLHAAHSNFATSQDAAKQDQEELRRLQATNTDIQVQLAQARGAHGQVRVEKEKFSEKLKLVESDRDRLLVQVEEVKAEAAKKENHTSSLELKNRELEDALAKALAGLQVSDGQVQTTQTRLVVLEKSTGDLAAEKNTLKTKIDSLEMGALFAARDKENVEHSLSTLQQQYDGLAAQQTHWDELRRASEQIQSLTNLISSADNEELNELRRFRDQTRMLEADHRALQKRFRDLETKAANGEKTVAASRQGLTQAQERALEWERRAKEYEGKLEMTETKLEQAEQSHGQLDADFTLIKLQLDDKVANDRLTQDSERKLRDQVAALEATVSRLQKDATKSMPTPYTNGATSPAAVINGYNGRTSQYTEFKPGNSQWASNGHATGARPPSRADTLFAGSRSGTPVTANGRLPAIQRPTVQDSIHAPTRRPEPVTPKARRTAAPSRPSMPPSPTPSTVSLAPTQGDDGWWS